MKPTALSAVRKRLCGCAVVTLALLMIECGASAAIAVRDASGRTVTIDDPGRIVSIGGSTTEILYALGLDQRIVAIDSTSLYPLRAIKEKPNVGYMRQLSAEGVLGLAPTLVLAAEGSGPKETIAVLEKAAVPFVIVPERNTGESILEKIALIAHAVGAPERGACLATAVRRDLAALSDIRAGIKNPVRVLFVLSFMNGRPMVAGSGTAADGIIKLAGAVNAADDFQGYKIVSDEGIVAARPDAILSMVRPDFKLTPGEVFGHPAFNATPAAAGKALIGMDGLYLLGFGPRTARAARDLAHRLYPSLSVGPMPSERQDATQTCGS
jgi:iron complex transport system substrate-binding protein